MPSTSIRRPPVATVEDYDEETDLTVPGSRSSANVSIKRAQSYEADFKPAVDRKSYDGSDSGYSSKAGTVGSASTGRKKGDRKSYPRVVERERQPYHHVPVTPEMPRQPKTKDSPPSRKPIPTSQPFRHDKRDKCYTCDIYGYHMDTVPDIPRPATVAPPASPRTVRPTQQKSVEEADIHQPTARRLPARHDPRPASMYAAPPPFGYGPISTHYGGPVMTPQGWSTPVTPSNAHHQYSAYPQHVPDTPLSTSYSDSHSYFDGSHFAHNKQPQQAGYAPYGEPVFHFQPAATHSDYEPEAPRPKPAKVSRNASRSDADRRAMPPPARPDKMSLHRTISKKSPTKRIIVPVRRNSVQSDDEERPQLRRVSTSRDRPTSPPRPPTSFRPPTSDPFDRPRPSRKSASYSSGSGTVFPASNRDHESRPRSGTTQEKKEADVEAYQANTNKHFINPLTADALKRYTQKQSAPMSEVGSSRSFNSKESGPRGRASTTVSNSQMTNITFDGGITMSIPSDYIDQPLDIRFGNLRFTNTQDPLEERIRPQRRLERAPSDVSQGSRPSLGSGISGSKSRSTEDQALTREITRDTLREEKRRSTAPSSKRSSRAASSSRPDLDLGRRDYRDKYIDYTGIEEQFYWGA